MISDEIREELADILEVEEDEIFEDARLDSFETWDSVAVLGVIALINEKTGKYPHADEIGDLGTIGELVKLLEA